VISNVIAFVDRLLLFELTQEVESGLSAIGYISLRFCGESAATLAPEMSAPTCAIECSALADEPGSTKFVN
jgi:hypothetical protein